MGLVGKSEKSAVALFSLFLRFCRHFQRKNIDFLLIFDTRSPFFLNFFPEK